MKARRSILIAMTALASTMLAPAALAQSWPAQPIRVVVPYPPGGATDFTARIYGKYLQQALGQSVVIDNKPGAGGEIGADIVAKAPADGYTFLFGAIGSLAIHAVIPSQKPPYELSKAFSGVSMGSSVALAVAVRNSLPVDSVAGLIALAKKKPDGLTYASAGNGSTQHLTGEHFKQRAGVGMVHVPYKGSGPAMTDLMGGQVDAVFETLPALSPHIASGKIKVLAVTTAARSPLLPNTPSLGEQDLKGFDVDTMYGMLAPRGTPKDIIAKVSSAMQSIARMPEVQSQMHKQGAEAKASSPEETDALIRREVAKWSAVAKTAKLD